MRLGGLITFVAFAAMTSPASAATHQVKVGNNNTFTPRELTITQGDIVNWDWVGPDTNHSTTTDASGQTTWDSDSGNLFPNHEVGYRFSWNFTDVGTFTYFCKTHSFMTGVITVVKKENDPNGPAADVKGPKFGPPTVQVKRRRVRFTLDEPAQVAGKLRGPTRRTLKLDAQAGTNVLKLPKRLKPGRYALSLRATDPSGNKSTVARVKFRVP
jgi:plastocyanin